MLPLRFPHRTSKDTSQDSSSSIRDSASALRTCLFGQSEPAGFRGLSGPPYVWTWIGTPVITGTHVYTFTADGLDVPARGLVFAGGNAVYLPVIFKQ